MMQVKKKHCNFHTRNMQGGRHLAKDMPVFIDLSSIIYIVYSKVHPYIANLKEQQRLDFALG